MDINLQGKRALVCGSTQGIGWASALALAELGAQVILVARNEEKLKESCADLPNPNALTHGYITADFSEAEKANEKIATYLQDKPAIHILVNNTGGPAPGPLHEADLKAFVSAFEQHLFFSHLLLKTLLPGMKKQNYGRIVNIVSTSVKVPIKGLGISNTTRGAVANWAKTLSYELGEFGITVNNVLPGSTNTQRLQNLYKERSKTSGKTVEEQMLAAAQAVPLNRIAEPHEVAAAVAFLASPAASYITGVSLAVDGGRTGCH